MGEKGEGERGKPHRSTHKELRRVLPSPCLVPQQSPNSPFIMEASTMHCVHGEETGGGYNDRNYTVLMNQGQQPLWHRAGLTPDMCGGKLIGAYRIVSPRSLILNFSVWEGLRFLFDLILTIP